MGGQVKYDADKHEITMLINNSTIVLNLGSGKATKDGKDVTLEFKSNNGTTYLESSSILSVLATK
ncbi:hypothetical protein D3C85_1855160 [compost metagenome]